MIPSFLTALCFAMAGISARQSTQCSGAERANTGRLVVGLVILGIIALVSWQGMPMRLLLGLAIAGGIGFGIGGFLMMQTLKRLGTPTALLLVESTTAIMAGLLAWLAVKDTMSLPQILACMVILAGVLFAGWSWMKESQPETLQIRFSGYSFGFMAATCQALSLVISRHVFVVAAHSDVSIAKLDAAFIRILGGAFIASLFFIPMLFRKKSRGWDPLEEKFKWLQRGQSIGKQPLFWIAVNGIVGPVLGVTCWLWAVSTMNPGIVQSIAAIAPLISLPAARLLEKEKLGIQFYIGAPIAIIGITILMLS